jgi:peptidoglycan hydrolase-like protein with peptidoglycan-binding domain
MAMARVLFAQGVRGEIVRTIQRRLAARGFDPQGIDGGYGKNTRKAVRAFQQQNGVQPTGEVSVPTWRKLMNSPVPPVRDRALQLTAAFEGHDFTLAQGNFDGAGITWGIIGFTLQGGELGRIVLQIQDRHPALVKQAFGAKTDQLLEILRGPKARQIAFANAISLGPSKSRLAEPWRSAFRSFGELPAVQALQLERADRDYFRPAKQAARGLRLKTELGLALAFDIHVQNGGVSTAAREEIKRQLAQHPIGREQERRVIVGNAVAKQSRPQFREDVRSRKLAIATGAGTVHGELFVLRNWGLADVPLAG